MQKDWEIEITGAITSDRVYADIKYHCGEVVASWMLDSFQEAGKVVDAWIKENPFKGHRGCGSEWC